MQDALIGFSGFVGSTLRKQRHFDALFRSDNIADIAGREFDLLVCAAAPAQKWLANREPAADWANIERLIGHLRTVRCRQFVLISTVDVFGQALAVDEHTPVVETGLHPYGLHRRRLEQFVENAFDNALIIRLPGLVGPGLRKNIIFDFLNNNNLHSIESRSVFQFYPMVNLSADIETALAAKLRLLHLAAEPVSVADIARQCFGRQFEQTLAAEPARYDMRSRHAGIFAASGPYIYSRRETMLAIRAYVQSEPLTELAA
ncbi:NAD-dependent epimerase/dehydratase family protein [Chitinimonas sp.]|uniref:NAD-dependent epimerase/dehydratase family protein n=1 Tax=Chitinimonas sp. TaxID=1934313 RepID=UPI0035ADF62F